MLQNWLRRTTKIYRGWENFATNFKQCCGLATDLIVDYVQYIAGNLNFIVIYLIYLKYKYIFLKKLYVLCYQKIIFDRKFSLICLAPRAKQNMETVRQLKEASTVTSLIIRVHP